MMMYRLLLGLFLLGIAALDIVAARDVAALQANPGSAWLVRLVGPARTRPFLHGLAAFIAFLGIAMIVMALGSAAS